MNFALRGWSARVAWLAMLSSVVSASSKIPAQSMHISSLRKTLPNGQPIIASAWMVTLLMFLPVILDATSTVEHATEQKVMSVCLVMRGIIYQAHRVWLAMLDGRSGSTTKVQVEGVGQTMGLTMVVGSFQLYSAIMS